MKNLGILLVFLIIAISANAQKSLSLSEAIQIGLANNYDIQVENLYLDIAKNNNNWAEAGRYPSLTLSLVQNNSITDINNPASFLQGNIISNSINPQVIANWMLFNGFSVKINRQRLNALENQSEGFTTVLIENTIQAIILSYYAVLLEQERENVLNNVLQLSKDRYDYVRLKMSMGSAVTFESLQAKTAFLTDSSNYIMQQFNSKNAVRDLNLVMGQETETSYIFTEKLNPLINNYKFEDLYEKMASNNNNLKNQFVNQELLRLDVAQKQSAIYPRLDLSLGTSYILNRQDLSNATFVTGDRGPGNVQAATLNYFANFSLSFNLFDGGRMKRQIQNSRIQERIGQLQTEELKLSLKNDLLMNYDFYNLRKNLYTISEENLKTSELNMQLGEDRFKSGNISSFDFRNLQVEYLNVALNNLQAIYNLVESNTQLLRLTGGILVN
ncbi:TolC family protein [soil metagenome]